MQVLFSLQYYFDTLFPRIPVPVLRSVVSNLEKLKLPTKHSGSTGEMTRGSDETARRPPSVKAALSVSFGQRAPHRASTRDSSPVRRTVSSSPYDRDGVDDSRRSPKIRRSQSRDIPDREYADKERTRDRDWERSRDRDRYRERDQERDRERDRERERDTGRDRDRRYDYEHRSRDSRRDYERSRHDGSRHYREGSSRRSRSRSRSRSQNVLEHDVQGDRHSIPQDGSKEKTSASSNLAKLRDLYGDVSNQKDNIGNSRGPNRDSSSEEVIRLGGSSWR